MKNQGYKNTRKNGPETVSGLGQSQGTETDGFTPLQATLPGYRLLGNYRQLDSNFYVSVQLQFNVELADGPDRTFRQTNFALLNFSASSRNSFCNVTNADRTEQFAFITCLGGDSEGSTFQSLGTSLGSSQLLSSSFFQLSATLFERLYVCSRGRNSLAIRQQEITTVTGLNLYLVAQRAKVCYFLEQNNFHLVNLFVLYSAGPAGFIRPRISSQLSTKARTNISIIRLGPSSTSST